MDCGYSLEPPRRGGSNEYHNLCFEWKYEKYQNFLSEKISFLVVKFSVYLKRHVFVMWIVLIKFSLYKDNEANITKDGKRYVTNVTQTSVNKQRYWLTLTSLRPMVRLISDEVLMFFNREMKCNKNDCFI